MLNDRIDATIKEKFETFQFIRLCYNLRRLSLIETNTSFITKSSISGIISPILLNTNDRISKEEGTGAHRDYFNVHFPLKDSL
ncbi:hypothetical protein OKW96_20435 [Sphingobacterium sp. KU25419]|nr:hypothetical protein OKW96_20435 [Sphingobacterium sp. KU25419]